MPIRKETSPGAVLATVCVAQFMVPLMLTAVGVALPSIGKDFNASAVQLGLVEQLYTLSLAMSMLAFGRLGDLVGRVRVFFTGLVLFTVMTTSLGFVESMPMLLVQRFFQGIGASILLSGSMALVASAYPAAVRGRKIGIVSAFTYSGLSSGPVLGGFITSHMGWRYIFLMVVPFGISACFLCLTRMRSEWKVGGNERMDWRGSLIYAFGTALVMLGASHMGDGFGVWIILAGLLLLVFFGLYETRVQNPLLDISMLLTNRFFTLSCFAAMGSYAATFGVTFFMSLYLQYAMGLSPRTAGFVLLLQPLMQMTISPMVGRLADRTAPVRLANIGIAAICLALLGIAASVGMHAPLPLLAAELILIGIGFGVFITPNTVTIMGSVEVQQYGIASGMIGTMRTLGMVTSMTTITLVFSLLMGGQPVTNATLPSFISSMQIGLSAFAVFSCVGVLLSLGRGRQRKKVQSACPSRMGPQH